MKNKTERQRLAIAAAQRDMVGDPPKVEDIVCHPDVELSIEVVAITDLGITVSDVQGVETTYPIGELFCHNTFFNLINIVFLRYGDDETVADDA